MTAQVAEKQAAIPQFLPFQEPKKRISWLDFEKKYLPRSDGYKYEWLDGIICKTKKGMEKKQFHILQNLLVAFHRLVFGGKANGTLINEGDIFFLKNHRKPDIAYLSGQQLALTARDINQVPEFVIEVISKHDQINLVEAKMLDYAAAGVRVVWQIFPFTEQIKVYSGTELSEAKILKGDMTCSAAPVLPDFQMTVREVFAKPPLPETMVR